MLTDEQQQNNYPPATLETYNSDPSPTLQFEEQFYTIDESNIVDRQTYGLPDYENNNGIYNMNPAGGDPYATSEKVYRLNGSNASAKKGLDFVAKVMAGDHVDIFGKSYHNSSGNSPVSMPSSFVIDLLSGLLGAPGGAATAGSHGATATALQGVSGVSSAMGALHTSMENFTNGPGGLPQAGICWILFDEQFHIKAKHFSPVDGPGSVYDHYNDPDLQNILVAQNGYLYVFCSNESGVDVFFDNLQVVHTRGPLLEETHYYPFGLTMAGISSKAAGKTENKIKFQGQEFAHGEFSDGSGLEMYEFKYRMDDPQTGRFWQVDPLADKYVYNSTYAFSENKVTGHVELEGLEAVKVNDENPKLKSPLARSINQTNVLNDAQNLKRSSSEAIQVKVSTGVGVGAKVQVGKLVSVGISATGPQAEASIDGSGSIEAKGRAAGVGVGVTAKNGVSITAGTSVGDVEYKDGKTQVSSTSYGADVNLVKGNKVEKTTSFLDQTFSFGVKLGAIGIEVGANVKKAGESVVNFFKTGVDILGNYISDKLSINLGPSQ